MDFNEYQQAAATTAHYPNRNVRPGGIFYVGLGLAGEAGEVANDVKKIARDDLNHLTEERREKIRDELGDVLWYAAMVADEIGATLDGVARDNLAKLHHRHGGREG